MRFDRESWRKLYIAESADHRLMPIFSRGLRDYLLRLAGDEGTILAKSDTPKLDLQILLGARSNAEKALVNAGFDDLVRVGYLSHDKSRLWITRFAEAQEARSPGAKRQAKYKENERQRKASVDSSPETSAAASPQTSPGDAPVTSQIDETRRDETTTPGPAVVTERISCPGTLRLSEAQRGTLESGLIPGWAIDQITTTYVAKYVGNTRELRTFDEWARGLVTAITNTMNGPNKPKKPEPQASDTMPLPPGMRIGSEGL